MNIAYLLTEDVRWVCRQIAAKSNERRLARAARRQARELERASRRRLVELLSANRDFLL